MKLSIAIKSIVKETLNKLIPLMVRQAHHERNQPITVHPEPVLNVAEELVKGLNQSFLKFVLIAIIFDYGNCLAQEKAEDMSKMSGHNHSAMQHNGHHLHHEIPTESSDNKTQITEATVRYDRDPNGYTDGIDFGHLSKPKMGDHDLLGALIVDRLEAANVRGDFSMIYDWQAWYGSDYDRLVLRAEGEFEDNTFKNARNEALWGHALTAFWDTQLGIRIDSGLGTDRTWAAFGIQGYAPYWVYVEATGYVGEDGRTSFRLETEYDILFTQKLILQPRLELNFYGKNDLSRLVSHGLSNMEAGLRLRYEFAREFAPYIGIEWAATFGAAADIIRASGKNSDETRFVAGVHFWF